MTLDINFDEYEVCETWTCEKNAEVRAKGPNGAGWTLVQMTPLVSPRENAFGVGHPCVGCMYLWKRKREEQAYR